MDYRHSGTTIKDLKLTMSKQQETMKTETIHCYPGDEQEPKGPSIEGLDMKRFMYCNIDPGFPHCGYRHGTVGQFQRVTGPKA